MRYQNKRGYACAVPAASMEFSIFQNRTPKSTAKYFRTGLDKNRRRNYIPDIQITKQCIQI